MDKSITCVGKAQCTGCGACYNICPTQAIHMEADAEGFLSPVIDEALCINCGKCLNHCPVHTPQCDNSVSPECFAVMAEDSVRSVSSSGGIFTLLAEWIIDQGGVVCGAAYTPDQYNVEHIIVTSREELRLLRGSKYVQSNTGNIYQEVKKYLNADRPVLFTGTPCQVAAIHKLFGRSNEHLFTLDLVCHGVPSPKVYKAFLQEQEQKFGSKAVRVSFRDKDLVGWNVSTTIDFANGEKYQKKRNECPYMNSFLKLLTLRESCGHCPFATLPRQGDMTIADFWDIHRFDKALDDHKGTSMALVNNSKGQKMLEVLRRSAVVCTKAPLDHAIKYNAQIKYSSVLHPRRKRFFDLLNTYHYGFEKAVDYGLNRRFDIGYVGWWYGANYGSVMTNYALNRVLTDMGKTVLMLEWPVLSGDVPKHKPDNPTRRFVNHFYEQSMIYRLEDYGRFNYHCDTFVVGSDQLWNWWSNRDIGSYHFFLDFADDKHKKIAYSTSFGHESAYYPEEMRLKIGYLLHRFDAVSVRESSGVSVCKDHYGVDAAQTLDPVFLCDMQHYETAISLSTVRPQGAYLLGYILNPTEDKISAVKMIADKLSMPYYIILDGQGDFAALKKEANDDHILENVEIADWLAYFKSASYIVTDSFHGFCFSIIFEHDMTVFPNALRGLSRFESLCQLTDLSDRLVYSLEDVVSKQPWTHPVDFKGVKDRLAPEVAFGYQWLETALAQPKKAHSMKERELKAILEMQDHFDALSKQIEELSSNPQIMQDGANANASLKKESFMRKLMKFLRKKMGKIAHRIFIK